MTRRAAVLAFELGQLAIALCAVAFVAEAPDRIVALYHIGNLALLSLALSAVYAVTGALRRDDDLTVITIRGPQPADLAADLAAAVAADLAAAVADRLPDNLDPPAETRRPIVDYDLLDTSDGDRQAGR